MNNKLKSVLITLIVLSTQANAQWRWSHPSPQGNNLNKISFINTSTGWAAGEKGAVIKSTNGGNSWTAQYPGTVTDISELQFTDSLHGFIAAESDLYISINSGASWDIAYRFPGYTISAMHFTTNDTGYIALTSGFGSGQLYKTNDGGLNWSILVSALSSDVMDIDASPNGNLFMCGVSGFLQRSTNNGQTWTTISTGSNVDLTDITAPTNNFVYAAGSSEIIKSTDGGLTFSTLGNPGSGNGLSIRAIDFANSTNGIAGFDQGYTYYTTDGGTTWNNYFFNSWMNVNAVVANSSSNFMAVGTSGVILKSNNAGNTWADQSSRLTEYRLNALSVINSNNVFAAGFAGTILNTTNGGTSWTAQNSNAGGEDLFDIQFINSNTGVAVGSNGTIVKTTDGGQNWNFIFSGIGESLYGLARIGTSKIYACGANGKLTYSTDNGDTWIDFPTTFTGGGYNFIEMQCFGNDTIVISVDQPNILSTYDNGLNWNLYSTPSSNATTAMYFRNAMYGWIGTDVGEIYSTTDGGNNWTLVKQVNSNAPIGCIHFSDPQNGWFSSGNEIYRTANGGTVWGTEISPNQDPIYDIDILTGTNALAVGDGLGTIVKRSNDINLSLPAQLFCTDNTYTAAINAIGTWNPGNQFQVELSDEFGEFIFPTVLGSVTATGTTPILITVPNGLIDGTDYLIRIFSTNPPSYSPLNSLPLEIRTSPDAYITAGGPTAFCQGGSVTLYAFTDPSWSYQWYKDGVLQTGATADTLFVTQTGNYTVNVTDGVCNLTSPIADVLVINCSGLAENTNAAFYQLFPNPSRDYISIRTIDANKISRLQLYDITGRVITSKQIQDQQPIILPVNELPAGVYQLLIEGDKPTVLRFVKL